MLPICVPRSGSATASCPQVRNLGHPTQSVAIFSGSHVCGTMVKPRRTKCVASCVNAQRVPNCSRRAVAPSDSIKRRSEALAAMGRIDHERADLGNGAAERRQFGAADERVAGHDHEEALRVATQILERARQQMALVEAGHDQRVHRLGLSGRPRWIV